MQENMGRKGFTAGENLEAYRRVKLSGGTVVYADAGEAFIGVTTEKKSSGEIIDVALKGSHRTFKVEAAEAFSQGAALYGAADGKVQDTASGTQMGTAMEAAAAATELVEVLFDWGSAAEIDGASIGIEAEDGNGAVPVLFAKKGITDANGADVVVVTSAPFKFVVIDWWIISRDTTAANINLKNGSTDMTGNTAKGTADDAIVRGGALIAAQDEIAAAGALSVAASAVAAFDLFVLVEKIR